MPQAPMQFGELEMDPANFEVRYQGARLKLGRIPLELLFLLAARAGQLVTYREAFEVVWGKGVVIEVQAALYTAVRKLRRALREDPANPRFIETVARKGYRFIVPAVARSGHDRSPMDAPKRLMLAVLPLDNLSGRPEEDYFSDGLTEEIIAALGRCSPKELGVIARTSVMVYKSVRKSVAEIGAQLGVDYLIEGSARHERGRVRIALQLIRVSDETHVWAEVFERPMTHVLRVQAEISKGVAESIRLELLTAPIQHADIDPTVYDLYLRGRFLWEQRTGPSVEQAIRHFEKALERDAAYAPAWAGLATCYAILPITGDSRPRDAFPLAREASDNALALDERLPQGHVARGIVHFWYEWNWDAAEREFRLASALSPNDPTAQMFLAHLHSNLTQHSDAMREIREARLLDPLSRILNTHEAQFFYNARRYEEAADLLDRLLQMAPRFWVARIVRGKIEGVRERYSRALQHFSLAHRYSGGNTEALGLRGYTLGISGQIAQARRVLRALELQSRRRYVPPVHRALVLLGIGKQTEMFDALTEAAEERDVRLTFLSVEPRWNPMRGNAKFEAIRKRVGLPKGKSMPLDDGQRRRAGHAE
jgi:TolB-like protein/Flp pilus assembly protein TadD